MKNKLIKTIANVFLKVGKHYGGNVSPGGYYKPKRQERT